VSIILAAPTFRQIYINKTHRSKTLHLLVEINNYVVEGLVDIGASMSVMATTLVRKLGIMHVVAGFETYKTTSRVITHALGRIDGVHVKVGNVQCSMTFMVVDIDSYDVLLGLDFLIKCGCGTWFNTSEAWSRSSCGSVTINYDKYVVEKELKDFDARCCCCFRKHTFQWRFGRGYQESIFV